MRGLTSLLLVTVMTAYMLVIPAAGGQPQSNYTLIFEYFEQRTLEDVLFLPPNILVVGIYGGHVILINTTSYRETDLDLSALGDYMKFVYIPKENDKFIALFYNYVKMVLTGVLIFTNGTYKEILESRVRPHTLKGNFRFVSENSLIMIFEALGKTFCLNLSDYTLLWENKRIYSSAVIGGLPSNSGEAMLMVISNPGCGACAIKKKKTFTYVTGNGKGYYLERSSILTGIGYPDKMIFLYVNTSGYLVEARAVIEDDKLKIVDVGARRVAYESDIAFCSGSPYADLGFSIATSGSPFYKESSGTLYRHTCGLGFTYPRARFLYIPAKRNGKHGLIIYDMLLNKSKWFTLPVDHDEVSHVRVMGWDDGIFLFNVLLKNHRNQVLFLNYSKGVVEVLEPPGEVHAITHIEWTSYSIFASRSKEAGTRIMVVSHVRPKIGPEKFTLTISVESDEGMKLPANILVNGSSYTTDKNGTLSVKLEAGFYIINVTYPHYQPYAAEMYLAANSTLRVILQRYSYDLTIKIETNQALKNFSLLIASPEGKTVKSIKVESPTCKVTLPAGEYVVQLYYEDKLIREKKVSLDENKEITIKADFPTYCFTVKGEGGEYIRDATIVLSDERGVVVATLTGGPTLSVVAPPAEYIVKAFAEGYEPRAIKVERSPQGCYTIILSKVEEHVGGGAKPEEGKLPVELLVAGVATLIVILLVALALIKYGRRHARSSTRSSGRAKNSSARSHSTTGK